jgi:hypothetical protein
MNEREHLNTLPARIVSGAAVAALGAAVGWGANALTLGGRVDAVERGMQRIEQQLDRLLSRQGTSLACTAHQVPAPALTMGPVLPAR